jgi:nitrate reductase (cytochrome), electron transfer subunit
MRIGMRAVLAAALALAATLTWAEPIIDAMRGATPILQATQPPRLANEVNDDVRQPRNFALQPPVIPHRVNGYQVDKNFNKCLDCHAHTKTEFSGAVPVSLTHFVNRDGRPLGQVSTRRYFCLQCHVSQESAKPLVGNSFGQK